MNVVSSEVDKQHLIDDREFSATALLIHASSPMTLMCRPSTLHIDEVPEKPTKDDSI